MGSHEATPADTEAVFAGSPTRRGGTASSSASWATISLRYLAERFLEWRPPSSSRQCSSSGARRGAAQGRRFYAPPRARAGVVASGSVTRADDTQEPGHPRPKSTGCSANATKPKRKNHERAKDPKIFSCTLEVANIGKTAVLSELLGAKGSAPRRASLLRLGGVCSH